MGANGFDCCATEVLTVGEAEVVVGAEIDDP